MANQYFKFKEFTIEQDKCGMKIGTDGILLGAWTDCSKTENALDIGSGTGVIAIMIAQKCNAFIDTVEIDFNSFEQAKINVEKCKWSDRIHVYNDSFQNFSEKSKKKYDLIVTNPPFFIDSFKAKGESRVLARHNDLLPFNQLIEGVRKLLSDTGKFSLILPFETGIDFINSCKQNNLFCNKLVKVKPNPDKEPKRILLEFSFYENNMEESELIIELDKRHHYSEQYKEITKDFYLYFKY